MPVSVNVLRCLILPALFALATSALAQSPLSRAPSQPPPDGGDPRTRKSSPDYRQYEYGKEIYAVKLGCPSCPLGERPLDQELAKQFMLDNSLSENLTDKEYEAVSTYLKQLFGPLI